MTVAAFPAVSNGQSLSAFLEEVFRYPFLESEEEYMLAQRFRDHGDMEAAHILVTSHLRLVVKIASGYRNYGLPLADMISEGSIGLMCAVRKFEPERGFRLANYAMWWIRVKIQESILNSWSLVRAGSLVTKKKLFWNLRRIKAKLGIYEDHDLTDDQIHEMAKMLDVSDKAVQEMNHWLSARDTSLNQPVTTDGVMDRIDLLVDESPDQEEVLAKAQEQDLMRTRIYEALATLDDRERRIIEGRILTDEPMTLGEIGTEYGISGERIRQLEKLAMKKLRVALEKNS